MSNSDVEKRGLNDSKVPLNCTNKHGKSAFETMTEDIALSENSQSLCLERAADDGIGSTDLSERAERVVSPRLTARSERKTWSLKGFSRPGHGNYGQFSYVRMHRCSSMISSLNSLKTVVSHTVNQTWLQHNIFLIITLIKDVGSSQTPA